jgi:2-phosphosulfolactate phosphatase
MSQALHVHLLPALIEPDTLRDGVAVIIDILRASSTMITALHNGATRVIPCGTTDEAILIRQRSALGTVVLGGERGGVKIDGFDFGNSPAEYSPQAIGGRTLAFTTTNGTKALLKALTAREIVIGAFVNRQAVVENLNREDRGTHLICAGTDGLVTGEDVLFAGAVVDGLVNSAADSASTRWTLNDGAFMSRAYWRQYVSNSAAASPARTDNAWLSDQIDKAMRHSRGGQNLLSLGYGSDILLCSQLDTTGLVPRYQREDGSLLPAD